MNWYASEIEAVLNPHPVLSESKEQHCSDISSELVTKSGNYSRMVAGEHLPIGATVARISKLTVVNVELPAMTLWAMLDVKEFAILSVAGKPSGPRGAPSRAFAPPGRSRSIVQGDDTISAVIEQNL